MNGKTGKGRGTHSEKGHQVSRNEDPTFSTQAMLHNNPSFLTRRRLRLENRAYFPRSRDNIGAVAFSPAHSDLRRHPASHPGVGYHGSRARSLSSVQGPGRTLHGFDHLLCLWHTCTCPQKPSRLQHTRLLNSDDFTRESNLHCKGTEGKSQK